MKLIIRQYQHFIILFLAFGHFRRLSFPPQRPATGLETRDFDPQFFLAPFTGLPREAGDRPALEGGLRGCLGFRASFTRLLFASWASARSGDVHGTRPKGRAYHRFAGSPVNGAEEVANRNLLHSTLLRVIVSKGVFPMNPIGRLTHGLILTSLLAGLLRLGRRDHANMDVRRRTDGVAGTGSAMKPGAGRSSSPTRARPWSSRARTPTRRSTSPWRPTPMPRTSSFPCD